MHAGREIVEKSSCKDRVRCSPSSNLLSTVHFLKIFYSCLLVCVCVCVCVCVMNWGENRKYKFILAFVL